MQRHFVFLRRKVPTLSNITLDIADGEFLCILGGNGSGKSTLAKHLNALLVPDSGSVEVDGLNTSDPQLSTTTLARSMVFQNPDDQLVATLVENDIAFGPENLGVPTNELRSAWRTPLQTWASWALNNTRPTPSRADKSNA